MSELPSKVDVAVAVPSKTKKVYTQQHQTTHNWMRPRPIFSREYIPGRNMKISCDSFIRCNPMPVPIFGHAKVHNRAFYVPFRTVARDFNAFYASTLYNYNNVDAVPYCVPYFKNSTVVKYFLATIGGTYPLLETPQSGATVWDITHYNNGVATHYNFTSLGYQFITTLESLGYKINWNEADETIMSALPLMCYAKACVDWYYPSQYVGSSDYNAVQTIFNNPRYNFDLLGSEVAALLNVVQYCTYTPDYFTNGWDTPTAPNAGNVERNIVLHDVTNNASSGGMLVTNNSSDAISPSSANHKPSNGTPFVGGSSAGVSNIASGVMTQYIQDALKSLTDFTKRHQLSGVRVIDRYLSELGINLSSEILNRSMYIGSQEFDMEFYDVFSHADTLSQGGVSLGAYAGKGAGYSGEKTFTFDNGEEFGMIVIINTIVPVVGYYQGQERETMHVFATDFYHGDFDHMAIQATSAREVYVPQDGDVNIAGTGLSSTIFEYNPKYIEYNVPFDKQTGLYRCRSKNGLLPLYSLMRDLSFFETGTLANMKHSFGFVVGSDSNNYNRVFGLTGKLAYWDQFNAIHSFKVENYDSTLPAYDTYEFEHNGNKRVKLDVNGSKVN